MPHLGVKFSKKERKKPCCNLASFLHVHVFYSAPHSAVKHSAIGTVTLKKIYAIYALPRVH